MSRRLGQDKALLPLNDRPAVAHCLDTLGQAGVEETVLVAGRHNFTKIREAVRGYRPRILVNDIPGADMAGSVRIGLSAVRHGINGIFIFPCDHPLVEPETLVALCRRFRQDSGKIVIPFFSAQKGHPTLFPAVLLQEIRDRPTLRDVISLHPEEVALVETTDEGTVLDIDTLEDYRILRDRFAERAGSVTNAGIPGARR